MNNVVIDFHINRLSRNTPTLLICAETNKGKVWYFGPGQKKKEHLILDNDGEYFSQQMNEDKTGNFKFLSINEYKNHYGNKTTEEVELETELKFLVYNRVN